jgi:hypothetical protein
MIFCCCAKGPSSADAGMFFDISCFWVRNVVPDMSTMSTTATTRAAALSAPRNVSKILAPKISAARACSTSAGVSTPGGSPLSSP